MELLIYTGCGVVTSLIMNWYSPIPKREKGVKFYVALIGASVIWPFVVIGLLMMMSD